MGVGYAVSAYEAICTVTPYGDYLYANTNATLKKQLLVWVGSWIKFLYSHQFLWNYLRSVFRISNFINVQVANMLQTRGFV